jgi:Sulfotransferase domain
MPTEAADTRLRVVGAGLGRTGTASLKLALERILGGRCYHMSELRDRPADVCAWYRAVYCDYPDWRRFLADFRAVVDWPAAAFWRQLTRANPDAIVLLSVREVNEWWESASRTIFTTEDRARERPSPDGDVDLFRRAKLCNEMLARHFTPTWWKEQPAKSAYLRHNDQVRRAIEPTRLIEWHPGDGWEPICRKLGVPVPDARFPHENTTAEFRARVGLAAR